MNQWWVIILRKYFANLFTLSVNLFFFLQMSSFYGLQSSMTEKEFSSLKVSLINCKKHYIVAKTKFRANDGGIIHFRFDMEKNANSFILFMNFQENNCCWGWNSELIIFVLCFWHSQHSIACIYMVINNKRFIWNSKDIRE